MKNLLSEANTDIGIHIYNTLHRQISDTGHPQTGGILPPSQQTPVGFASQSGTAGFVASCLLHYIASHHVAAEPPARILPRAIDAMDFLIRSQNGNGRIDLKDCNYDSAPDTAFVVQQLVAALSMAASWRHNDPVFDSLCGRIETFAQRAIGGLVSGGFHTPNHRWVISSALCLTTRFVPGLSPSDTANAAATINAFLAETIDIDAEGTFIERSVGAYDAVCDLSLILLEEFWPEANAAGAGKAAAANLKFNLYLIDSDGTAETGLSRRQDYGTRPVPVGLAACYLLASRLDNTLVDDAGKLQFAEIARFLWQRSSQNKDNNWRIYALLRASLSLSAQTGTSSHAPTHSPSLPDFKKYFPINKFWRVRHGDFSATAFANTTRLLNLNFGAAKIVGIKISQSYFGVGKFIANQLELNSTDAADAAASITLRDDGHHHPRRPGYDLPIGTPVPNTQWEESIPARPLRPIPPAASELKITVLPDDGTGWKTLELIYRTTDGLDNVTAQIALDFDSGGVWETNDTTTAPFPGQVIFLKQGSGRMHYGLDVIEIEGGAHAHTTWKMRDAETAPNHVRVLLTFVTPIEHRILIKARRGF